VILLWDQLVLRQAFKDEGTDLGVYNEAEFKSCDEVTPGIESEFVVVAFLSNRKEGVLEEEIEECPQIRLETCQCTFDRLTLKQSPCVRFCLLMCLR
jgi:hypothetical protein